MVKLHSKIYGWKYVWMEFSQEFNATVDDPDPDSSHTLLTMSVPIAETGWTLFYTMHPGSKGQSDYSTVEVNYKSTGDFKFAIHPEGFVQGFQKLLGMQDIVIGHEDFDKGFIVKGNDEERVKKLFEDAALKRLILDEPNIQLWADCENSDSTPTRRALHNDRNLLSARVKGAIDDFERLNTYYKLMYRVLQSLCRIEAAEQ
ncbi:MAG: hypothetical protein K8F91_08720 [Candidatus Obscuribacterales bacterium]|nr:hypothetical protein [Candidatus Obscuribacterales bacterium]